MRPGFTLLAYAAAFAACAIALTSYGYGDPRAGLAALVVGSAPFLCVFFGSRTHLRTCTASLGCSTACLANRTSSAPATTCMETRDDTTSTDRTPSAALDESIECADSCKQVPSANSSGSTGSKRSGVFMPRSVPSMTHCNNFNANPVLTGDLQ
jgi:hypothetical protein